MIIWIVVWIFLMMFWLLGGGFVAYDNGVFNGRHFVGYSLIPWAAVLILGLIMFGAVHPDSGTPTVIHHQ